MTHSSLMKMRTARTLRCVWEIPSPVRANRAKHSGSISKQTERRSPRRATTRNRLVGLIFRESPLLAYGQLSGGLPINSTENSISGGGLLAGFKCQIRGVVFSEEFPFTVIKERTD